MQEPLLCPPSYDYRRAFTFCHSLTVSAGSHAGGGMRGRLFLQPNYHCRTKGRLPNNPWEQTGSRTPRRPSGVPANRHVVSVRGSPPSFFVRVTPLKRPNKSAQLHSAVIFAEFFLILVEILQLFVKDSCCSNRNTVPNNGAEHESSPLRRAVQGIGQGGPAPADPTSRRCDHQGYHCR